MPELPVPISPVDQALDLWDAAQHAGRRVIAWRIPRSVAEQIWDETHNQSWKRLNPFGPPLPPKPFPDLTGPRMLELFDLPIELVSDGPLRPVFA